MVISTDIYSVTQLADSRSAGHETTSLLSNPNTRYRVQKSSPLDPILSQLNPIQTPKSSKMALGHTHPLGAVGQFFSG
jgi:hypothetical protein